MRKILRKKYSQNGFIRQFSKYLLQMECSNIFEKIKFKEYRYYAIQKQIQRNEYGDSIENEVSKIRKGKRKDKKLVSSLGKLQSPIAIKSSKAISINLPAIENIGFHNLLPIPIKLQNNGFTIMLSLRELSPKEIKLGEFLPYITGGKLSGEYEFSQLHFHWGSRNCTGTEHTIDDIPYVMEMHMLFTNKKYKGNEALNNSDGLAVMAFLYRISEFDAPGIDVIIAELQELQNFCDNVEMKTVFSLSSLIQKINLNRFYTYKGSLTTPPYSEAVTWNVFPDPLQISLSQIEKFRQLKGPEENSTLSDNYREKQPIGKRRIFLREGSRNPYYLKDFDDTHHSKWQWVR